MGVPSFYRWLSRKYPKIVLDVLEQRAVELADGSQAPLDTSAPNPNGFEIDNLYLDMNGIIHPCCHPEDGSAPDDEDEMIQRIFLYIDRIFGMVRPRQVLYMAIDGVAPRAKMNQQRSRRFRSAKEVTDKEIAEEELRAEWVAKGLTPPPKRPRPWDSNVITPGTPFMAKLSRAIHWYVMDRQSHDSGWRGIKVIFSDAKVPGEGEHKIMQFIRRQRAAPGYNPNTRHCLYGMDADLIMLGLASHDPHFLILRETITDFKPSAPRCFLCNQTGHRADQCTGIVEEQTPTEAPGVHEEKGLMDKPFQFLLLNVLREYLAHDLYVPNLPFAWDLERAIDDFVFLCFFVGNDFLPHLPLLEIREGAIERLVGIYRRLLPSLGGYISEPGGRLNLSRVDVLLSDLGVVEDSIFKQRKSKEDYFKQRDANRSSQLATRRAATLAARESALAFAEKEGYSTVKGGLNVHGKNVQPHIKKQAEKQGNVKPEIYNAPEGSSKKRKSKEEPSSSPDPTAEEGAEQSKKEKKSRKKSKKVKLEDGSAAPAASTKNDQEEDAEDEEVDDKDPGYKPSDGTDDSSDSSSSSDSEGEEEDGSSAVSKSKKRKQRQAAKKHESALKKEEPVDNLKRVSTSAAADALDEEAAALDFNKLLNAKLKALNYPTDTPSASDGEEDAASRDPVRFGEEGWKERYYLSKMNIARDRKEDGVMFHRLFKSYAEGLSWVMRYYYDGCASWSWYYPFHYAPMASDLCNLDRYKIEFDEASQPFKPIGQLMGVLPALSAHALPEPCAELMVNPTSPIIDFYPEEFPLDLNGAKQLWRAVALLPWIDEKRLLQELDKVEPKFTPEEKDRNSLGVDYLFVHKSHLLANSIYALYNQFPSDTLKSKTHLECSQLKKVPIDVKESGGMNGYISPYPAAAELGGTLKSEVGLPTLEDVQVMSVIYTDPDPRPHQCALLPGLIPPPPVLTQEDFEDNVRGGGMTQMNAQRNNRRQSGGQQQGGGGGNHSSYQAQHGGQTSTYEPKYGAAPSHFQQAPTSERIWSSGYNQGNSNNRGGGGGNNQGRYQHQGGQGGRGYNQQQPQQAYQQQSYPPPQQPAPYQYGGYGSSAPQQQQQQPFSYTAGYAAAAGGAQPGGYAQAYQQGRSAYTPQAYSAPQPPQPYSYQPQAYTPHSYQPPSRAPPGSAPPAATHNQFAALQQQIQSTAQAFRSQQPPPPTQPQQPYRHQARR